MLEYTIAQEANCQCIAMKGRIDALSAPEIQKIFHKLILDGGRVLLADMSDVHYISSAGLRIFIITQKELKKVGGELLFSGLAPQVLDVFKMSGFNKLFRIIASPDDIPALFRNDRVPSSLQNIKTDEVSIEYVESDAPAGSLFLIGSTDKMENAAYTEKDVVAVPVARMHSGCGLAALGNSFEEYKNLFGEAMVINGNFFYYPAVRHSSVDFMLNAHSDQSVAYRFLNGFGVSGDYRYLLSFKSDNGELNLTSLINNFLSISRTNLIGITLLAESKGIWGMNIKKPPIIDNQPSDSENIFESRLFPEWFDFPVEPAHAGAVVAATGIAVHDPHALPQAFGKLFIGGNIFHLHGGIFAKAPINNNLQNFDRELARIFNELEVFKIQHLLGQSRFAGGLAGIIEIEV
ncbi:MAG: STAS domain-containing protein [Smithella sp.]